MHNAVVYGQVPSKWIQNGAFPSLRLLDLSGASLGPNDGSKDKEAFGPSWFVSTKLGGMPAIQQLLLYNPFDDSGMSEGVRVGQEAPHAVGEEARAVFVSPGGSPR